MPAQQIDKPNPPPAPSSLPDFLRQLRVELDINQGLTDEEHKQVRLFRRAADFIAASMIFLKKNAYLDHELTQKDIKPRLLGHWGTVPGLNLVYAHLNLLVKKLDLDLLLVVGPGHGAPSTLACLWLEGALARFLPKYTLDGHGLEKLVTGFSVPGGFPSHINAETPGAIHEGGELGYALSVSFGAVCDNPDLIVTCVVGDGEAETGPTATAWHAYKYIDPAESGAVLPIVHVNGFKISERTIYGCMDDLELVALFTGYGYQVRFVETLDDIDRDLAASLQWAVGKIRTIQKAARSGQPIKKPRWPVLILRTPKGWGGPKISHGEFVEGSFHAHQVPLPAAGSDSEEFASLKSWLESYRVHELLDKSGTPLPDVTAVVPTKDDKKIGLRREAYAAYTPLDVPDWQQLAVESGKQQSCMQSVGSFLREVIIQNPKTFRIWSPDELVSNKLDAVFEKTSRNFQWDISESNTSAGGRIIEILSEHTCQGMLQGYTLTGRTGLFPSYESFLGIVHTMCVQYAKFVKMARETTWRQDCGSLNYIETSTWTRQEHNGFSHQNPSFIGAVLNLKPTIARVYLPPDANCALSTIAHCLRAKNYVNLIVGSKQPTPVWLSKEEADKHCIAGASVWKFASVDDGLHPDVVLTGIGVEVTFEVIAAAALLQKVCPALRVRVVNVTDLMVLEEPGVHPHALTREDFNTLFTPDRSIVINYHSYPIELRGLMGSRGGLDGRLQINGYSEEGTTTTPFCMMLLNGVSRFHVAAAAVRGGAKFNEAVRVDQHAIVSDLLHHVEKYKQYALENGKDIDDVYDTPQF